MLRRSAFALAALWWATPVVALAQAQEQSTLDWAVGASTLIAAIALLVIALGLSRVAAGSAMADNISYVVAACACLGASVLAGWAIRFVDEPLAASQVRLGAQFLIIVTMALLCVYFYRVRAALERFLDATSASDALARAQFATEQTARSEADGRGDEVDA